MVPLLKKVIFDDFILDLPIMAIFGAVKGNALWKIAPKGSILGGFQKISKIQGFSEIGLKFQLKRFKNEKTAI